VLYKNVTQNNIIAMAGGGNHSLALREKGEVLGWGCSSEDQLGIGHTKHQYTPQKLEPFSKHEVVALACGWNFSIALNLAVFMDGVTITMVNWVFLSVLIN